MNCQEFNEQLYEYLDEALPANVQASAREHLQRCEDCRHVLEREKAMAKSIGHSLDIATARLSISPKVRRTILEAPQAGPMSPGILSLIRQRFALRSIRFAGVGAALLASILLFVALNGRRHPVAKSSSPVVSNNDQAGLVIDVPFQTQTHVLRQHDGGVVDEIAPTAAVGHAVLFEPKR